MPDVWTLHETPHRHYKLNGKWSIDGVRITSVTQVLDNSMGALTSWAASQALAASEQVARDWLPGTEAAFARSLLSFGELAALQPEWPDNVRDDKGDSGTAAHHYLAERLNFGYRPADSPYPVAPYGLRMAIDKFIEQHRPMPVGDDRGLRVERIVGSRTRAVAGTYDAQLGIYHHHTAGIEALFSGKWGRHRVDLKQSNTIQPKHWAQVAAYERDAVECGEEPSDYLSILHITPTGTYKLHSIESRGAPARQALELFDACLAIHRLAPKLAKLTKDTA